MHAPVHCRIHLAHVLLGSGSRITQQLVLAALLVSLLSNAVRVAWKPSDQSAWSAVSEMSVFLAAIILHLVALVALSLGSFSTLSIVGGIFAAQLLLASVLPIPSAAGGTSDFGLFSQVTEVVATVHLCIFPAAAVLTLAIVHCHPQPAHWLPSIFLVAAVLGLLVFEAVAGGLATTVTLFLFCLWMGAQLRCISTAQVGFYFAVGCALYLIASALSRLSTQADLDVESRIPLEEVPRCHNTHVMQVVVV